MRKIDVFRHKRFSEFQEAQAVAIRLSDWRKIRRVLRAAEELYVTGMTEKLRPAYQALNAKPREKP